MDNFSRLRTTPVFDLLKKRFQEFKEHDALVHLDDRISYAKLQILVDLVAQRIKNEAPEEKLIAISCSRSVRTIVNLLGVLAAGKAYVPFDFDQPQERLQKIVSETQVRYGLKGLDSEDFSHLGIQEIEGKYTHSSQAPNYTSDLAYILFTSGTTGVPKGIEVCNASLVNLVEWQVANSQSGPGFNTLHFARLTFDISFQEIFSTLVSGGTLHILNNEVLKDPHQLLTYIQKNRVHRLFVPFIALQGIANAAVSYQMYPDSLREIMTCGEQVKVSNTIRKFFSELATCKFFNQYGPTETTIIVSQHYLEGEPETWDDLPSIGWPISNVEMFLVGPDGKAITTLGAVGEIYITGDCLARGYFKNEKLTAELFRDLDLDGEPKRFYKSGDLAEWNVDGSIKFLGRIDDQVKINGFRVELGEIEVNVSKIEGIEENAVVIGHFKDGQNYVALFYKCSASAILPDKIKEELRKSLPEYMIPYKYVQVEAMPRTGSGKIDRKSLKTSLEKKAGNEFSAASNDSEFRLILADLWKELLEEDSLGPQSHFFQLGGSSILAQKLSVSINEKMGKVFPVALIYQNPTFEKQLAYLTGNEKKDSAVSEKLIQKQATGNRDVAVIAMAGKFPGADNPSELWELIKDKKSGISHFELDEIDPLVRHEAEESNYIKARGVIKDYDKFDASFFGMNPKLAEVMDPQQRKFLEISHDLLEKAGWIAKRPDFRIGVFAGTNNNTYYSKNLVFDHESLEIFGPNQIMSLNEKDYVASRVAFQLNLTGPAVSVHSACSTSLLAIAQAVMSIRTGQCTAAIAGASSITFPVHSGQRYQEGAIFSNDGECRPFDSQASGTLFCDGAGAVLLKDYEAALADGDKIFAVVKGIGISNDGLDKASFTSPSIKGEASAIRDAILDAGIKAEEIGLVEAHGTATPIGDPIEVEGLKLAFGPGGKPNSCAIGSVKSNVGHLTAAAGIAGFIKAVYALHDQVLPATRGFETSNPEIKFEDSPFYVNKETKKWDSQSKRIAGVSSFGFGGTNVHVILQEAEQPGITTAKVAPDAEPHFIVLSAKSDSALKNNAKNLSDFILKNKGLSLRNLVANYSRRYKNYGINSTLVFSSEKGLLSQLDEILQEKKPINSFKGIFSKAVFLFPGQGSQYVEMGMGLYQSNPDFRKSFDACCQLFDEFLDKPLKDVIFHGTQEELSETRYTQPAIFTVSYAMSQLLIQKGIEPMAFCGHSIGEYVAAHLAGVFSLKDVVKVVASRGKLIYALPKGQMLSVRSQLDLVKEILPAELAIAAHNAPNLCVVSGEQQAIEKFQHVLEEYGMANQLLHTSHAFHSPMMDGALADFQEVVDSVQRNIPQVPIMSTQTGQWLKDGEAVSSAYWVNHIRNSVLFHSAAKSLIEEHPDAYYLEVGPGNVLSSLLQQQSNAKDGAIAHVLHRRNEGMEELYLFDQLAKLISFGAQLDSLKIQGIIQGSFMDVPTYGFDKKICWIEKGAAFNPAFKSKPTPSIQNIQPNSIQVDIENKPVKNSGWDQNFDKIKEMLESTSGVQIQKKDSDSSFFELGLDSLVLTQFTFSIKKEFGVAISFRQINDELNTPKALLDYLERHSPNLAKERYSESRLVERLTSVNGDSQAESFSKDNPARLIQEQLESIQRQLSQLYSNGTISQTGSSTPADSSLKKNKITQQFQNSSEKLNEEELSEEAKSFFDSLEEEYTSKTGKSREYHQSHHLNDKKDLAIQSKEFSFWQRCSDLTYPLVSKYSDGSKLIDLDGNEYLDWHFNYGSKLFGYNADFVKKALKAQISEGLEFGSLLDQENEVIRLFKKVTKTKKAFLFDHFSEAVLKALLECLNNSDRKTIVVISENRTFEPGSRKLPCGNLGNSDCIEYLRNHLNTDLIHLSGDYFESMAFIQENSAEIGTVLFEVNTAERDPEEFIDFLDDLRLLTIQENIFLVLNETQSGFNTYQAGVSELMENKPEMVVFGNLIGESLKLGILGLYTDKIQTKNSMESVLHNGMNQFKGDSFVLAATASLLREIEARGGQVLNELSKKTSVFIQRVNELLQKYNAPLQANSFRAVWRIRLKDDSPWFWLFFVLLRREGIHMIQGMPCFFTAVHTRIDLEQTLVKIEKVLGLMIENDLLKGDLPDLEELVMDTHNPPFPGAKIGFDQDGNPIWVPAKENN